MSDVTRDLLEETQDFVEQAKARVVKARKPWQTWLDAEWGLRNYWYPASLSRHLAEGESKGIQLLGEEILLTRQNGRIHAIEDRCPHLFHEARCRHRHYLRLHHLGLCPRIRGRQLFTRLAHHPPSCRRNVWEMWSRSHTMRTCVTSSDVMRTCYRWRKSLPTWPGFD